MIVYLDPNDHDQTGSPFPFWLRFEEAVDSPRERAIKAKVNDLLGVGTTMPSKDQIWKLQIVSGYVVLMFRSKEDRDLARIAL
jgi:hypothetical protein